MNFEMDVSLSAPIMDAQYEKLDVETIVNEQCACLTSTQQIKMKILLTGHARLFKGNLGRYTGEPTHIELEPIA